MKYFFIIMLIAVSSTTVQSQEASAKRGVAYGYHSPEDLEVLSRGLSWWYNWAITPESSVAGVYESYGFDFVPMAWNGSFNETELRAFLDSHPDVQYILGFNEPNFIEQANMTPSEAAANWAALESVADDYGLTLVGPAVNFCGNCVSEGGTTYTDPFEYLDDFLEACTDCRIDHIAVHSYMNTVAALEWYIGEFKRYEKPIWLTEFAGWEPNGNISSVEDQINFIIGAVDFLEYDTTVFRYAWFIGRGDGIATYPYIDLLGDNGQLTPLGEVYVQMPVHDTSIYQLLPGRIEAEAYTHMSGILLEKTADLSGFANVGYIDPGDWLSYQVDISEEKEYYLSFRIASTSASSFDVLLDDELLYSQQIPNTGGWQNWQTFFNQVLLPAGKHTLTLKANTAGYNINWFEAGEEQPDLLNTPGAPVQLEVYPNPAVNSLQLISARQVRSYLITDLSGQVMLSGSFSDLIDISGLAPGLYHIRVLGENGLPFAVGRFVKVDAR